MRSISILCLLTSPILSVPSLHHVTLPSAIKQQKNDTRWRSATLTHNHYTFIERGTSCTRERQGWRNHTVFPPPQSAGPALKMEPIIAPPSHVRIAPAPIVPPPGGLEVAVMTFNVRYDSGGDGAHAWRYRAAAVASVIQASGVVVVGLQEVLWSQYLDLLRLLGDAWVGVFRGRNDGGEGEASGEAPAIVWKKDVLYSTAAPYVFWFSPTPEVPGTMADGTSLPRACLQLHFIHLPSRRAFWMLNAHLDHTSPRARARSTELLLEKLPAGGKCDPVIVTGDFNAPPTEPSCIALRSELVDTVAAASAHEATRGTFHGFAGGDPGEAARIDYIYASSGVMVRRVQVIRDDVAGVLPSDHYPVAATLRWR